MKLATFLGHSGAPAVGVVDTARGAILDLALAQSLSEGVAAPAFVDMLSLIRSGEHGLEKASRLAQDWPEEASSSLSDARLLAPIPEPPQMRDCISFELHLKNAFRAMHPEALKDNAIPEVWYRRPIYYKCNRFSFVGHEADVRWPRFSEKMDFELEMACIIGRGGVDITREQAPRHIFGYTIFNDFSARDEQRSEMTMQLGPAKGKDFDTGNVLGPWIVTADEIGDPHKLEMRSRVNGEPWGGGNSSTIHHTFYDMVSFISTSETLHVGEIIGSGTVGTGCGLELGRFLKPGDVVELEIERIGVLRNRLVKP